MFQMGNMYLLRSPAFHTWNQPNPTFRGIGPGFGHSPLKGTGSQRRVRFHVAMGQNTNRTPGEHPNPTTKIKPKRGGEFTNPNQNGIPRLINQNGFDHHGHVKRGGGNLSATRWPIPLEATALAASGLRPVGLSFERAPQKKCFLASMLPLVSSKTTQKGEAQEQKKDTCRGAVPKAVRRSGNPLSDGSFGAPKGNRRHGSTSASFSINCFHPSRTANARSGKRWKKGRAPIQPEEQFS